MFSLIVACVIIAILAFALCKVSGDSARREEYWWRYHPDDDDGITIVDEKRSKYGGEADDQL